MFSPGSRSAQRKAQVTFTSPCLLFNPSRVFRIRINISLIVVHWTTGAYSKETDFWVVDHLVHRNVPWTSIKFIWIPFAFERRSGACNHIVIALVNDRSSINVLQSCNFQLYCIPIFVNELSSCGFTPTRIVSFTCCWVRFEEWGMNIYDNQFFGSTTISTVICCKSDVLSQWVGQW